MFMAQQALPDLVAWISELMDLSPRSPKRMAENYFRQDWDGA